MTAYEMRISDWSSDLCSSDRRDACRAAIGAEIHARRDGDQLLDCRHLTFAQRVAVDGGDSDGNILNILRPLLRRHNDVSDTARLAGGSRAFLRLSHDGPGSSEGENSQTICRRHKSSDRKSTRLNSSH